MAKIKEKNKHITPPKGGFPASFEYGSKVYTVSAVNIATDEVSLKTCDGKYHETTVSKLRDWLKIK